MDVAKILSLPPAELKKWLLERVVPKPWKHEWDTCGQNARNKCQKCGKAWASSSDAIKRNFSCPVPNPIALDWNLAKKMQAEIPFWDFEEAMKHVFEAEGAITKMTFEHWWKHYAQPHHYILAAILAGEGK